MRQMPCRAAVFLLIITFAKNKVNRNLREITGTARTAEFGVSAVYSGYAVRGTAASAIDRGETESRFAVPMASARKIQK